MANSEDNYDVETDHPWGSELERVLGKRPSGIVGLRNFDQGVVETLRAEVVNGNYYIRDPGLFTVDPPPGQPGVPVTFAFPDDNYEHWRFPVIMVRRDDISPAMNRWHPGMAAWRSPAAGANPVSVTVPTGGTSTEIRQGFDKYEVQQQAAPFDLTYTISIMARHRGIGTRQPVGQKIEGTASPRTQANRLLDYVLRIYQPYGAVFVKDSQGCLRSYEAFMEAISHLDQVAEVADRMIGFAVTVRIEAELDLNDPQTQAAVQGPLTIGEEVL